jgi:hypothetical protein
MFYRFGFEVVQGASPKPHAMKGVDDPPWQVRHASMLDVLGQIASGGDRELARGLGRVANEALARQRRFQPAIHFQHERLAATAPCYDQSQSTQRAE